MISGLMRRRGPMGRGSKPRSSLEVISCKVFCKPEAIKRYAGCMRDAHCSELVPVVQLTTLRSAYVEHSDRLDWEPVMDQEQ